MTGLPLEEENIAEILYKVVCHNGIIGNWNLGTNSKFRPNTHGFDEFYGFVASGHRYFPEDLIYSDIESVDQNGGWYNTKLLRNETRVETDEYLTDEFSNEGVDFIERNAKKPFFLYLTYNAPHTNRCRRVKNTWIDSRISKTSFVVRMPQWSARSMMEWVE
jgi:arylsulfatase A-like enzyme